MNLLLDTHAFLWWDSAPDKLSDEAHKLCLNADNILTLSTASVWEMQIKQQLGKLTLRQPLQEIVQGQQEANGLVILDVSPAHIYALQELPPHHRDPFDRVLVAQARTEGLSMLTADAQVQQYDLNWIW